MFGRRGSRDYWCRHDGNTLTLSPLIAIFGSGGGTGSAKRHAANPCLFKFPYISMLFYKMQLQKVTIKIVWLKTYCIPVQLAKVNDESSAVIYSPGLQ